MRRVKTDKKREYGFTITEILVTLFVISTFLGLFFQAYILMLSQRTAVVRQSKADSIARANLQLVSSAPQVTSSSCPADGWDLVSSPYVVQKVTLTTDHERERELGTDSSAQLRMYCTSGLNDAKRIVSKVTYKVNGVNRAVVYATIAN